MGLFPDDVPDFPLAFASVHPLALKAETKGSPDFTLLYCGQAATLCREIPARDLTLKLAAQALEKLAMHAQAETDEFRRVLTFARSSERGLAPGGR